MKSRDVSTDRDEEEESAEPLVSEEPPAAVDGTELLGGGDVATITARPASLDSQDCLCITFADVSKAEKSGLVAVPLKKRMNHAIKL